MSRWDKFGIPHKGWKYIGIEDLGADVLPKEEIPYEQCEMCGNEKIRFVHILSHPEVKGEIRVGCSCAEKMIENYSAPKRKERELQNRTKRRASFLRKEWKQTKKGFTLRFKGENITIVKSINENFGVVFRTKWRWDYNGKRINDFASAKLVAFDLFDELYWER